MFRSLTSFIFGSNTSEISDQQEQQDNREPLAQAQDQQLNVCDVENTIHVTSSTPSVTGDNNNKSNNNKRGKNRRNNRNNKRKGQPQQQENKDQKKSLPQVSITKLLTPSNDFDEELDEDDWFIVEKECEDEDYSLPRTDSEEELTIVEVKSPATQQLAAVQATTAPTTATLAAAAQRRRHHIDQHSLYSGPRPQQQRNYLQRARNSVARNGPLSVSALSLPRSIASDGQAAAAEAAADGGVTQSLYATPLNASHGASGNGSAPNAMEESWFVTPPPCFTSVGPIHMETSPFENLLIEHPSMSVYFSIRSAQEAAESFVNLDLGVKESQKREQQEKQQQQQLAAAERNSAAVQRRSAAARMERFNAAQLKQELLARSNQKSHDMHERRQAVCRGAIKRANKARDYQSKGNRQRRSDMQHCRVVSGANNNRNTSRKCCF